MEGFGFYYDPLYDFIPLSPLLRQAIDLPEVQRLRRLNQLAVLSLVFPGATHTRFSHSIGLCYLCEVMWTNLIRWKEQLNMKDLDLSHFFLTALQLAALFHDVGHGPFSHIFEMFCERYQTYKNYKHEQITQRLITKGIGKYNYIPTFLKDVRNHYQEKGVNEAYLELFTPESIANLAIGNPPVGKTYVNYAFLGQLLHSPCDIDRLDYLRRDSYFTGVEIGSVDVWQIIHSTFVHKEEETGIWKLYIDKNAAEAVEALLIARDLAYRKVYYNQTHRSNQELIIRALFDLVNSKKADLELLVLKDDFEIMREFENNGTLFTDEVGKILKERSLYEPLPIRLNEYEDLDNINREKRVDLWKKEYQDVMNEEMKLSKKLDIWPRNTVMFDFDRVPLAEDEDVNTSYLFDKNIGKPISLLEALPHLKLIYGEDKITDRIFKLGDIYRQRLSNFFVYVPYQIIEQNIEIINDRFDEKKKNIDISVLETFISNECNDVLEKFNEIFVSFISLVGLAGIKKNKFAR